MIRPAVVLWKPKTAENIGAALRACGCYDADLVIVDPRCQMDKRKTRRRIAALATWAKNRDFAVMDESSALHWLDACCDVVAVEKSCHSEPLEGYSHPRAAAYIFGPEEGAVPTFLLARCPVVQIPTVGCLNLAAAVATVLYDRAAKL